MRPRYYPKDGEDIHAAYRREADTVRKGVGIVDVTSLGKIDVQGPDAAEFLDRVYANTFSTLKVGRARYGAMLRDDGIVFDDGTTSRLSENHYFMTTTTANAGTVMAHMEMLLQTAWQELRVHLTSVSDQWAGIAVAGPKSRELLSALGTDIDMSDEAFPFMGVREGTLDNAPVRIFRISFSGELAYEIYTTSDFGDALCIGSGGGAGLRRRSVRDGSHGGTPYREGACCGPGARRPHHNGRSWPREDGKHEETLCRQCLEGTSCFAGGGSVEAGGAHPGRPIVELTVGRASARRTVRAEEPSCPRRPLLRQIDGEARDRWQSWLYHIGSTARNSATMSAWRWSRTAAAVWATECMHVTR